MNHLDPATMNRAQRETFWRCLWDRFGADSTDIMGTGYKPDDRGPREYAAPWHPDDDYRTHHRERKPGR